MDEVFLQTGDGRASLRERVSPGSGRSRITGNCAGLCRFAAGLVGRRCSSLRGMVAPGAFGEHLQGG